MSRMKWNLDLLEEVKNQHDEALISTEHVVNRVRSDLFSMTEEVWEGEDADIARDQLHELSFKEMPDTYDQIDTCNNVIQKAQKEAYESKNFCNDFPQIFRNGSMPSDGNQSRCTGDLMCDEDSCEGLKSSMKAAGENARNVHSAISSVESILASLETDFAKFDYSSYTQPIKEQTQKVAERTEMYNTAVTRYEQKTKELDHTLSNALKLATPDFVPAPLDPSCLGIGDEIHFGDSKITGSLEEYITAKIDGELDEAQIKDILSMLFDKENVDISEYSEEDFGMAFIKLSEEKKRAMLMEMGYSKEQIDSILDSCKGNKAVAVGNSIGRTLIEKIADKDGNKHGRLGKTGKASTLGLAGIKRPGQLNTDFAKTNAGKTNAASATGGTTSNNNQKSKPKPAKNNSGNNTNNSGSSSTGNNTSPAADPYAEYKTGDPEVDKEIDRLFEKYGDDLSECYEDENFSWENASKTTRRALSRIAEVDLEKIEYSLSDDECLENEKRVETILQYMITPQAYTDETVFYSEYLNEMYSYMTNGLAKKYIAELGELLRADFEYVPGFSEVNIRMEGAGVVFELKDMQNEKVTEILCHTSMPRANLYIDYCEKENPGCFDHEYKLLGGDSDVDKKQKLARLYDKAKTTDDLKLLERLFKSDETYSNVFVESPGNISSNVKTILGYHACMLADDSYGPEYTEYLAYTNAVLDNPYLDYISLLTVGSGLAVDAMVEDLLMADYYGEEEKRIARKLEIANNNELLWNSIYFIRNKLNEKAQGIGSDGPVYDMKISKVEELDFFGADAFTLCYSTGTIGIHNEKDVGRSIEILPLSGAEKGDWVCETQILELERLKEEAAKDLLIDTACSMLDIYCKGAGKGIKLALDFINDPSSTGTDKALEAVGNTGKEAESVVTLYSAFGGLLSTILGYDTKAKTLKDAADAELFGSLCGYQYGDGTNLEGMNYYVKLNDYKKIKALKEWNRNGCSALFGDGGDELEKYWGSVSEINQVFNYVKSSTDYSDEQIRDAFNAIIYGCNDPDHESGDYKSISEIPTDLRSACLSQLITKNADEKESIQDAYSAYVNAVQIGA